MHSLHSCLLTIALRYIPCKYCNSHVLEPLLCCYDQDKRAQVRSFLQLNWRLVSLIGKATKSPEPFCKRPDLVKHHHCLNDLELLFGYSNLHRHCICTKAVFLSSHLEAGRQTKCILRATTDHSREMHCNPIPVT